MFTEFGEGDYDAFAGCSPVGDLPPLITYLKVKGWPEISHDKPGQITTVAAIIDGVGVTLQGLNGFGRACESEDDSLASRAINYHRATGFAVHLVMAEEKPMSFSLLTHMGFKWRNFILDNPTDLTVMGEMLYLAPAKLQKFIKDSEHDIVIAHRAINIAKYAITEWHRLTATEREKVTSS